MFSPFVSLFIKAHMLFALKDLTDLKGFFCFLLLKTLHDTPSHVWIYFFFMNQTCEILFDKGSLDPRPLVLLISC